MQSPDQYTLCAFPVPSAAPGSAGAATYSDAAGAAPGSVSIDSETVPDVCDVPVGCWVLFVMCVALYYIVLPSEE